MAFRAAKNGNSVIMEIGNDEGQSGATLLGNTWCDWTFSDIPAWTMPNGMGPDSRPMMFKEDAGTIAVRTEAEVLAAPNG